MRLSNLIYNLNCHHKLDRGTYIFSLEIKQISFVDMWLNWLITKADTVCTLKMEAL